MKNRSEEEKTAEIYRHLLDEHGLSFKTLNWGSREGQQLRFSVLAQIADLRGCRVLDVGCGLGDLYEWIQALNRDIAYTGLDLTPELVEKARLRHPGGRFISGSILDEGIFRGEKFDYILSSGIFYTYRTGAYDWMKNALGRMWNLCEKGMAFNTLSGWSAEKDDSEFYADPGETVTLCHTFTPWVAMRHDYHPRDFTMYLYRREAPR